MYTIIIIIALIGALICYFKIRNENFSIAETILSIMFQKIQLLNNII